MSAAQQKEGLTDWGPVPFEEPLAVLARRATRRADLNDIGVLHPALGHRAQPADAAARPGVDPAASRDPRRADRRADRGRRHDALRHDAAAAAAGRRPALPLRLRLGGRRGRARSWTTVLDGRRPADRRSARRARRRRASSRRSCSPSTRCTRARPRRRSSSSPTRSCRTSPRRARTCPRYRSWIDGQDFAPAYDWLRRMLQLLQWQKRQARARPAAARGC